MIASGTQQADGNRASLDDTFRRAGVRHSDALALVDPMRSLTYAQADRAISAFADRLRALGLSTDAVVAMQLPNTVESVIALLGILRAGMIAAPLPSLWRKQEMVAALSLAGAKAIVTFSTQAGIAVQVAAKLFPVRAVAGFGHDLPDGVVSLDDVFADGAKFFQPSPRLGNAAAHVAAITFDVTAGGIVPITHSHGDLIAAGLSVFHQADIAQDAAILSTIPTSSYAGIVLTVMQWLLTGGTLALHHGFDPATFTEQFCAHPASTIALPGRALMALSDAGLLNQAKSILSLWRASEPLAAAVPWYGEAVLVDIACFGEAELLAARRGPDGLPTAIPPAPSHAGITAVGGYRFRRSEIEAAVAEIDSAAIFAALPDALLGERLAGSARDNANMIAQLQAHGVNALIAGAFGRPGKAV